MAKRCSSGKIPYGFKRQAMAAKKRIDHAAMQAYRCTICHQWHLGRSRDPYLNALRIDQVLEQHELKLNERLAKNSG